MNVRYKTLAPYEDKDAGMSFSFGPERHLELLPGGKLEHSKSSTLKT